MQQPQTANPLMHMINQMQQVSPLCPYLLQLNHPNFDFIVD